MKLTRKLSAFFDRTIVILGVIGAVILICTMLAINYEVIMRYFLGQPNAWMLEVNEYALCYLTFLGAAWVLRDGKHIKMDLVLSRLNPRTQAWINTITSAIFAITCLLITWYGVKITLYAYEHNLYYHSWLMPPKFIIIGIVPLGSFLVSIQFLRIIYGNLRRLTA